jgi:hypothetical protein
MSIVKNTLGFNASTQQPNEMTFARNSVATFVNNIGNIETAPIDKLRLDYNPSDVGKIVGWLLEESSTNTVLQSQDFTTTWAVQDLGTISANATMSPTGSMMASMKADALRSNANGAGKCAVAQAHTWTSGSTYTVSVYAKKDSIDFLEISTGLLSNARFAQTFNLSTGTVGNFGGAIVGASRMVAYPNGWYRCEVTFTADANTNPEIYLIARNVDAVFNNCTLVNQDGIFVWGMQVEELPYSTSYIQTTDATVTREADVASVMATTSDFNWTVGATILVEAATYGGPTSPVFHYMDSGSTMGGVAEDNSITYYNDGKVSINAGGASQLPNDLEVTGFTIINKETFKTAVTFGPARFHASHNTVLAVNPPFPVAISTLPMNVNTSNYTIKFFHGRGLPQTSGHLRCFKILPNVLSDAELQSVTIRQQDLVSDGEGGAGSVIYDGSVTRAKLAPAAVGTLQIEDNSITSAKIAFDVIVADDIAANAITVSELQDNAVAASKIQVDAVDGTKISLANEAAGDIMYHNGTDWVRLAKGTDGHVLKSSDTPGTPLEWGADGDDSSDPFSPTSPLGDTAGSHVTGTITLPLLNPNVVDITILKTPNGAGTTGQVLSRNASGELEFINVSSDPAMGGDLSGVASNAQIVALSVGNAELAADAVTNAKLADDAVQSENIVDLSIENAKLAVDSVSADKLRDHATVDSERAVTTDHIRNISVTEAKIATGAVSQTKIADNSILSDHIVNGTITSDDLGNNAVTNLKINNLSVTNSKIATDAITTIKIADGAVTAPKLGAGIIVAQTIAANAVNGTHLQMGSDAAGDTLYYDGTNYVRLAKGADGEVLTLASGLPSWAVDSSNVGGTAVGGDVTGTVSNITIPTGSITSDMLGLDVIVAEDIANNAITFAELADNAVKTAKIENNAVDGTKIAMGSDVSGDILYYDGTNYIRLGAGANDQVLTVSAGVPSWAASAAGGGSGGVSAAEATATAVTMAIALG